jgi:hypothetical protein
MLVYGEVMTDPPPTESDDDACRLREPLELSGSWAMPLGRRWFGDRYDIGWPFGKLSVANNEIVFSGRGPFRFIREVIPLDDIVRVERAGGWIVPRGLRILRFRTRSSRSDRTRFGSTPRRVQLLEERLEKLGLSVHGG